MKGLELAERYYLDCGLPMLERDFPDIIGKIAIGMFGSGSQCYGYDDEISQDHDFEPGFIILLPEEDIIDSKTEFLLERAYRRLPDEYLGYRRNLISSADPYRQGVFRLKDYFLDKLGTIDGSLTLQQWLTVEDFRLLEATNGKVFRDDSGILTEVRNRISAMPEDIFLKKLAGNLQMMDQSGQYNYDRSILRSDTAAAQLSLYEYVKAAMKTVFLLNHQYMPYYKWAFTALKQLPKLSLSAVILEYLITNGNSQQEVKVKKEMMQSLTVIITDELVKQRLLENENTGFSRIPELINRQIKDPSIRNLDILTAV